MQAQDYPGNVRELRNLLERAALLCDGNTVEIGHIQQALSSGRRPLAGPRVHPQSCDADITDIAVSSLKGLTLAPGALRTIERAALQQLISGHQGSRADLARKLGISERSLCRKFKALE